MVKAGANCWYAYVVEDVFGGGKAGTRAVPVAPTSVQLTGCPYPLGDQGLPFLTFKRMSFHPMGSAAEYVVAANEGLGKREFTIKQLAQVRTWADAAVVITAGGSPTTNKSYCFHWENGVEIYNAYGCYITKYKVSTKKRDWILEEITFGFDTVVAVASVAQVAFQTQAPLVYANAAQPDLGAASVDTEEMSVEITNTYADNELIGSYYGHVPVLLSRDIKAEFTGKSDVNSKVATAYTAAIVPFTATMGNLVNAAGTAKDITITNMMLDPEASDFKTLPERDLVKYKFVLIQGGLSVITVEA